MKLFFFYSSAHRAMIVVKLKYFVKQYQQKLVFKKHCVCHITLKQINDKTYTTANGITSPDSYKFLTTNRIIEEQKTFVHCIRTQANKPKLLFQFLFERKITYYEWEGQSNSCNSNTKNAVEMFTQKLPENGGKHVSLFQCMFIFSQLNSSLSLSVGCNKKIDMRNVISYIESMHV